jgi:hypothetical protein
VRGRDQPAGHAAHRVRQFSLRGRAGELLPALVRAAWP